MHTAETVIAALLAAGTALVLMLAVIGWWLDRHGVENDDDPR